MLLNFVRLSDLVTAIWEEVHSFLNAGYSRVSLNSPYYGQRGLTSGFLQQMSPESGQIFIHGWNVPCTVPLSARPLDGDERRSSWKAVTSLTMPLMHLYSATHS